MASPFSAVLRSNYAASAIEAPQIEQIITKHDKEIANSIHVEPPAAPAEPGW